MTISSLLAVGFFFVSCIIAIWYKLFYCTQKALNNLVAKGAMKADFKLDPRDDYTGVKKAVQDNPDLKFIVRKVPGKVILTFLDADMVKEIITNHNYYDKLNKKSSITAAIIGESVILASGPSWKLHRTLLSEVFQYNFFNNMISTIIKTTDAIIGFSKKQEIDVKLPNTIEYITADVATTTFFGIHSAQIDVNGQRAPEELSGVVMKIMQYAMSPFRFFPGLWALNIFKDYRDLKRRIRNFRNIFGKLIQKRLQELKSGDANAASEPVNKDTDVLEILLQQRIKYNNDPSKTLSDIEILDDFFVFCVAGKDTTSSLVSMALYCCEKYPEWGAKLKEEVNKTITTPEAINLDLLNSMTLMSAFLNEVLRVFPPIPVLLPRIANRDHYIGDLFVEKGTILTASIVGLSYNPKYFQEPEKFNPARWLKTEPSDEGWKNNPFSYIPFSGGSRNCIGKHFALIEARVILSLILKNFEVKLDPTYELKIGYIGVAYLPKEPMPFKFIPK